MRSSGPKAILVRKECVVHQSELALSPGGLRRLGRHLGMRVYGRQWKMPEHEAQRILELRPDRIHDRMCGTAVRAFVIAVLEQRKRRIDASADMIRGPAKRVRQEWLPMTSCSCRHLPFGHFVKRAKNTVGARIDSGRRPIAPENLASRIDQEKRALTDALVVAIGAIIA